jgi:hypothetical protein
MTDTDYNLVGMLEIQRALGRIEGQNTQLLKESQDVRNDLVTFKAENAKEFALRDLKIAELTKNRDQARGAGWVILGLLGAIATFVGAAVLSVINGKLHINLQ